MDGDEKNNIVLIKTAKKYSGVLNCSKEYKKDIYEYDK